MRVTVSAFLLVALAASATGAQQNPPPPSPFGGLAPPPPQTTPGPAPSAPPQGSTPSTTRPTGSATEQQLRQAEDDDSGRGLEFAWLNVEGGFQTLRIPTQGFGCAGGAVCSSSLGSASGGSVGAGLGARFLFFTVGVRGRMGLFSDFKYVTLDPEVGLHIPIGNLEPYLFLGGGYSTLTGISSPVVSSAHGFNVRFGAGLDYYLAPMVSIGAAASVEYVSLTVNTAQGDTSGSGSINGADIHAGAVLGLHF